VQLSEGPTGTVFDFRHETRGQHGIIDELGRTVLNVCHVVPDGVVLFCKSLLSFFIHIMTSAAVLMCDISGTCMVSCIIILLV
jgi:hypothetical protein